MQTAIILDTGCTSSYGVLTTDVLSGLPLAGGVSFKSHTPCRELAALFTVPEYRVKSSPLRVSQ